MPSTNFHVEIDSRSLAMHRLIAERIRCEPTLFSVPVRNVERWAMMKPVEAKYLKQWREILGAGMDEALRFAVEDSERATELRQSTPFAGVLTPRERWAFLKQWNEKTSNI
jgi:hypothetical protein